MDFHVLRVRAKKAGVKRGQLKVRPRGPNSRRCLPKHTPKIFVFRARSLAIVIVLLVSLQFGLARWRPRG